MMILQVPLPDALVERLGGQERAATRFSEAAILELLRAAELTSGEAAEALGIPRRAVLELMASHDIPVANYPPEEIEEELDVLRRRRA